MHSEVVQIPVSVIVIASLKMKMINDDNYDDNDDISSDNGCHLCSSCSRLRPQLGSGWDTKNSGQLTPSGLSYLNPSSCIAMGQG